MVLIMIILAILLAFALCSISAWLLMLLWNLVIVPWLGVATMPFWIAFLIVVVIKAIIPSSGSSSK